jgi:predicted dehydrogenase
VFVEKPLCLTLEELTSIESQFISMEVPPILMVGFNRRFAPQVQRMKQLLKGVGGPKAFVMTVNAGAIPAAHWVQDKEVGGGRIVGEACHFIDLLRFLAGVPVSQWQHQEMDSHTHDTVTLSLKFTDGSVGTIHYFANGSKSFPKERLEVFASGRVLQLDNFRRLTGYGWPDFSRLNLWRQDKGQRPSAQAFVDAIQLGKPPPIPVDEIFEVSRIAIEIAQ